MAESVVSFLLEKLVALAEQEVELLKDVQDEIEEMKREFQSIKAFLKDADAKVDIDQGVKEWVEQVRDVAYEIEDVLDDYLFCHYIKEVDNDVGERHGSCIGSIAGISQRVIDFFKYLKSQHEIGYQIQDISMRIQAITNRRRRFNINNSVDQGPTLASTTKRDPREDALFLEEFQLVGIENAKAKLVGHLLETETRLGVVAVYGQGGLGKTTLVKKVYDNPKVKGQFPYRAWITVSQIYDAKSLLKSLMKQLLPTLGGAETMEAIELKQMLNNNLRQKRYVVVLDDMWELDAWKDLKNAFPNDNENGSRIMVTTRSKNIADTCLEEYGYMYPLQPLDPEDSWKLFYKKAFKQNVLNMNVSSEQVLRDRSAKFLKKCNGLPLAIVAIGGLLSVKQPSEWDQVYHNLGSLIDGSTSGSQSQLRDLNFVISLSYNDLPYHLKSCFLYLCVFPEDYPIDCSRLLRLWVGEGFVKRMRSVDMTMDEIASLYLDELIQRSLVQVTKINERNKVKECRIHDLMRDFIIAKARNQNLATIITEKKEELEFVYFRLLRVLDINDVNLLEFPSQVVNLLYLRYLSLRPNHLTSSVPDSVGKLVHLETFDLKCNLMIRELPAGILKLRRLRNLLAYGVQLPAGIHRLTTLEKLEWVNADEEGSSLLVKELGMLPELRKLAIRNLREDDSMQLFASVQKMKYLSSFKVWSKSIKFLHSSNLSSPPSSLKCLHMGGALDRIPCWIPSLQNLEEIQLYYSGFKSNLLQVLQVLPNLVILRLLDGSFDGEELSFVKGFPRLKRLFLRNLKNLNKMEVEQGSMPVIGVITFIICEKLEFPLGLENLTTLDEIISTDMSPQFVDKMVQHCWKPGHLPQLTINEEDSYLL
ncbi:hypothetical protein AQUCO_00100495v1 [Aquilegia coerulea]|uniref:AAA+ ATPase domain-containing protein n=1 Tax=Aquilegia coerulea TaxID=218851 RepID=A0A2G5FAJ1_AQUCA|nr:hypothetical protein AQUCO_00100495v1 [Aquilegia coerulea]